MPWLDKLRNLFPELKSFIKIDSIVNIKITRHDHSKKVEYSDQSKQITFNPKQFSPKEKELFKSAIDSALDENYTLLEDQSNALIEDFRIKDGSSDSRKTLEFLRDKIPAEDFPIWRAALYLAACVAEGEKVADLKADIITRYGTRGRNIANLCSAGYLEDWLIPAYKVFKENSENESSAIDKFQILYRIIVEEVSFSVFVSYWMKSEEIKKLIQNKMETNLNYGVKFVNIHGIGKRNVKIIRAIIEEIEGSQKITKSIKEENKIIFVRLGFEPDKE